MINKVALIGVMRASSIGRTIASNSHLRQLSE